MSPQQGKVKNVSSGDTLVLTPLNGRLERTLCLAYVTAPRMRREEDEVCPIHVPNCGEIDYKLTSSASPTLLNLGTSYGG